MSYRIGKALSPDRFYSEANVITIFRLIASLIFFILAILRNDPFYNYVGFFIHWLVDFIDGFYARRFKQETILGAEIDIIADRFEIMFFYIIFLHFRPYLFLPAALYLIDYAFIDFYLSYQFVKFDIISPNYFYKVDQIIYRLNYSPAGKFSNSSVVTLGLIFLPQFGPLIAIYAVGLIIVKSYSVFRLFHIQPRKKGNEL